MIYRPELRLGEGLEWDLLGTGFVCGLFLLDRVDSRSGGNGLSDE